MDQQAGIPAALEVELPNAGRGVTQGGSPAEWTVQLPQPIRLVPGSTISVSNAFLSLFSGAAVSQQNIILEKDYSFTMVGVAAWTYMSDRTTFTNDPPADADFLTSWIGSEFSQLDDEGDLQTVNIPITIPRGSYSPQALVALFNRQSSAPAYITGENVTNWPAQGLPTLAGGYNFATGAYPTLVLPFQTFGQYGQQISGVETGAIQWQAGAAGAPPVLTKASGDVGAGALWPNVQVAAGSTAGLTIDFDANSGLFRIAQNFSPVISNVTGNTCLIATTADVPIATWPLATDMPRQQRTVVIDRSGEVLIQDWGYANTDEAWAGSFWARLGFARTDLYRPLLPGGGLDPFTWGRCYPNADPGSCLQTFDPDDYPPTDAFLDLKPLSQAISLVSTDPGKQLAPTSWEYDGSTIGIFASNQAVLNPLPYARCTVDILPPGENSGVQAPGRGVIGYSQPLSLVNQSAGGVLSFAVYNPVNFVSRGDYMVGSIAVRIEDPRGDGRLLSWLSSEPLSTVFLRIITP